MPTYNRPRQVVACLHALTQLDYPRDRFEVIVVNDGGQSIKIAVESFMSQIQLKLINQENMGPAQARNQGAELAEADFLAFTDDDCCPSPDWLKYLAQQFKTMPIGLVGGAIVNSLTDNLYSTASQVIIDFVYQYYNLLPARPSFFASCNIAFPRRQFLALGGFHPDFRTSEDREICDHWLQKGYTMAYQPQATVYHAHELNFKQFWEQHLGYGRGAFNYHGIRVLRGAQPFRPNLGFYVLLLTYPLRQDFGWRGGVIAILIFIAQLASTVGYFLEKLGPPHSSTR